MSDSITPLAIGVTGGIGCGKSTVLSEFARLDIPSFFADRAGAACYDDPQFCREVIARFGTAVDSGDGHVDKRRLASLVFADKKALDSLNAMIHPKVIQAFHEWKKTQQSPYVLFESAILYDYGFDSLMDRTVVVYLDVEERVRRIMLRDRCSRADVEARMACQMSGSDLLERADYVILNYEGNPRWRQVQWVHQKILSSL